METGDDTQLPQSPGIHATADPVDEAPPPNTKGRVSPGTTRKPQTHLARRPAIHCPSIAPAPLLAFKVSLYCPRLDKKVSARRGSLLGGLASLQLAPGHPVRRRPVVVEALREQPLLAPARAVVLLLRQPPVHVHVDRLDDVPTRDSDARVRRGDVDGPGERARDEAALGAARPGRWGVAP